MPRRLPALACLLSLAIVIGVLALWFTTSRRAWVTWSAGDAASAEGYRCVAVGHGALTYHTIANECPTPAYPHNVILPTASGFVGWDTAGLYHFRWQIVAECYSTRDSGPSGRIQLPGSLADHTESGLSLAWPLAVFAVLPGIWLLRAMVRQARTVMRPPAGLCPKCGYDLCATPEQCPECGTKSVSGQ